MPNEDQNRIENLQKEIYDRNWKNVQASPEQHFSERDFDVDKKWQNTEASIQKIPNAPRLTAGSFFKKIFIFSIIFFIISAGLLVFVLLGGWNISAFDKIDIQFLGPVSVSAGSELDFDIVLKNQNSSDVENAVLYIDYPDGTKSVSDITQDLIHDTENLGSIVSGGSVRRTSRSIFFGELNAKRDVKIKLEYNLKDSNNKFVKEKTYSVMVSSTPITIKVKHPDQIVSGDVVPFDISITSNSTTPLQNLLLKAEYPFGFLYLDADPEPDNKSGYWLIKNLDAGETKNIKIGGQLQGEQNDERVFHFSVGTQSANDENSIATRYLSQAESIFIQKPLLGISLNLEGSSTSQFATDQGSVIRGSVNVSNNMQIPISDIEIKLEMKGQIFDRNRVSVGSEGFFRSSEDTIIWNKTTSKDLTKLDPGNSKALAFSFATIKPSSVSVQNGTMSVSASVTGKQASNDGGLKTISSSRNATILARTVIGLISRAVYSVGPFTNTGPIPPKADTKTTYTIIWTAKNSLNDARDAEVRATLPTNVSWLGVTSPSNESVSWNQDKNEVVWRIGDLSATSLGNKSPREVAFQVELLPSLNQVGRQATLVSDIVMTAVDSFTNSPLTSSSKDLTTSLSTDPKFGGEESIITR